MKYFYTTNTTGNLGRWTRFIGVMLMLTLMATAITFSQYDNPAPVPLLTAGTYGALAFSGITTAGVFTVNGDVGSSTASISTDITATGTKYVVGASEALQAQTDLAAALSNALGRTANTTIAGNTLGGLNLGCGIYEGGALDLASGTTLTLTGNATDIFIIKAGSTLTINTGSTVVLTGGAVWSNVFWYVGSSATILGGGSTFNGIILAEVSITLYSGSTANGQLLAHTGAVTINSNVLPVEMVSFTATANRLNAELHWSTATEVNNYGFEIERRQTGSWEKVGFVIGAGTSNSPQDYSFMDNSLSPGRYVYRIKQIDNNGTFLYHGSAEVEIGLTAKKFSLESNYPNPFNPSTTIQFTLGNDGMTSLQVYNMLGQKVATLFNGNAEAGRLYQVTLDATSLPSGVYFYRLEAGSFVSSKKLILMK